MIKNYLFIYLVFIYFICEKQMMEIQNMVDVKAKKYFFLIHSSHLLIE